MFQKKQNKISKRKTGWEQCVEKQLWGNIGKTKRKTRIRLKPNCRKNIKTARNDGVLFVVFWGSFLAHFGSFSVTFGIVLDGFWHQFHENGVANHQKSQFGGARGHLGSQGCEDEEKRAKTWFAGRPVCFLFEPRFGYFWGWVCRFRA